MRIGVFDHGWWKGACEVTSHESVTLPVASHPSGNAYAADLGGRLANGVATAELLANESVDLLIDNGGTGLGFVRNAAGDDDLKLMHESTGKPLLSHFIDPLGTALQGLAWPAIWQCLASTSWVKAVWDRAHVNELQRFGVPNVIHLPMAAPQRKYDTRPIDPQACRVEVSFVGNQNTTYFSSGGSVPTVSLLAGTFAQSVRNEPNGVHFYDAYHDLFGLGDPVTQSDSPEIVAQKTLAYYNAKLFHHAALCMRNRDRFVIFLKRRLADRFQLIGDRWDTTYGLPAASPLPTTDAYFNHFRETAINLNFVNGNAETGLNMRHFEITAAGGFMLCYQQPELAEQFEIGTECVVFTSETDLIEKIDYYLAHPDERNAIAQAGQKRTLSQHLYRHRLESLLRAVASQPLPVEYSTSTWSDDFQRLVPEPDVVLDCGANTGQTATGFRKVYPNATIYSFEPVRALFDELRVTCDELGVQAVCKAVGDRDGTTHINLTTSHEANSLLDYQEGNPCAKWTWVIGQEEIEICTLDRWCKDNGIDPGRVDVLKLDVQGAELKALYGARKLLESTRLVFLEVSFVRIYKDCPLFDEIDRFMVECGYRRHAIYASDQPHNWGDALYVKT
ncbi:MAG: FkbM family methyltransferase [Planctomycetes bacterium]|nr:FkbM family methyltransferase [Planctomycetota bacterium]